MHVEGDHRTAAQGNRRRAALTGDQGPPRQGRCRTGRQLAWRVRRLRSRGNRQVGESREERRHEARI